MSTTGSSGCNHLLRLVRTTTAKRTQIGRATHMHTPTHRPGKHTWRSLVAMLVVTSSLLAGCSLLDEEVPKSEDRSVPAGPSWAPAPRMVGGLSVSATSGSEGFALHTKDGDVEFLPGVNLGSTTPSHQPGELAISAEDYRRWFPMMGDLGVRVVRIYTIHPPAFYEELASYNKSHPDAPLYLMQGVYLPDESYVEESKNLYDDFVTTKMQAEIVDAVDAVHGNLERAEARGRAEGTWTTDVSEWTAGWLIGVEWDPFAVDRTDRQESARPGHVGTYFSSTKDASPTERWIAARLDETAAAQVKYGSSSPVALVNWPSVDPLSHPEEPLESEDLVGVDANHVLPTPAWPAGSFASYHAYPYYPDFQKYEPALQSYTRPDGVKDSYEAYLLSLQAHHAKAGLPLMVTETGVPSSLGSAHFGSLGRDQGDHSEAEAMAMDAQILRQLHRIGTAGGLLFSWSDEWFKLTWNTIEHQVPADRRQLWHDPLTNEQHFGLLAQDAVGPEQRPQDLLQGPNADLEAVTATYDESYVHLQVKLKEAPKGPVIVGLGSRPDVSGSPAPGASDIQSEWSFALDPSSERGRLWVRDAVDPVRLDLNEGGVPPAGDKNSWRPFRLLTNRSLPNPVTGVKDPAEYHDTGLLRRGEMRPGASGYDNRNLWDLDGDTLTLRVPWALAGLSDPSSSKALVILGDTPLTKTVDHLTISVEVDENKTRLSPFRWESWNRVYAAERPKEGLSAVKDALHETSRPASP